MEREFLMELLNANSVSGSETEIEKKIYRHMLPVTPVGPMNINEPSGLFGSLKPERFRRIASLTT